MAQFKSVAEIEAYIRSQSRQGMKLVGENIKKSLEYYVMKNVYSNYNPQDYERTFELLQGITYEVHMKGGEVQVEIFFDKSKMHHSSLFGSSALGVGIEEEVYIPKWVDEGKTWGRKQANFMEDTKKDIQKNIGGFHFFAKGLVDYFRSIGIKVKKCTFN